MAFCTQCGTPVGDADRYCGRCGAPQPAATGAGEGTAPPGPASSPQGPEFLSNMNARTASLLCYLPWVGWIAAIVVLASARFRRNRDVRFNAFQGLYLFVVWLIIDWVISPIFYLPGMPGPHGLANVFRLGLVIVWVFMLIKVSQGENYRLPIVGELAERSVTEQI